MTSPSLLFDSPVLQFAAALLKAENYYTERRTLDIPEDQPVELLLAENPHFILAMTHRATLRELENIEPFLAAFVVEQLQNAASIGDKKWDAHLVLLAEEPFRAVEQPSDVFDLAYDTRYMRRLVRLGVAFDLASVQRALSPFLSLQRLAVQELSSNALDDLAAALVAQGIPRDDAVHAVDQYRARGEVTHG